MKAMKMNTNGSIKAMTVAAMLIAGAAGMGVLTPPAAMAQVKSVADVKTMLKSELPANALEITAAMKSAKVGQMITVRGTVAMSKDAFGKDTATFTLVDESVRKGIVPAADKLPDASGDIPAASKATVQVTDANGKPLRAGLSDQHGLKPGAEVFVTGKVETANGTDALVLTATSLHVSKAPLPSGFFVEKQPDSAKDVSEVRKAGTLKAGDEVVLRGRIGGSKEPFVAGRAVLTLMGKGLKACNENPDDKCSKPWDYCCETKQDILANSVTVQVVDAKGQILRTDMKGRRGLKELSEIVVVGKVASADGKTVVVNASSVYAVQ
ncbi:MAG: hypothetical protein ACKVW3_11655 [Phycisphaerales bacterium]